MATHSLDPAAFRLAFPAFADPAVFPDPRLQVNFGMATAYLGDADGCLLRGAGLQAALDYLTAHLLALSVMAADGGGPNAPVTGSTVDKVSVQLAPPPFTDGWEFWLSQTSYGQELWALLSIKSAGGLYVGGSPERSAFRRVGGGFGPFGGWR
jgi:hypothetical protein